jgi:hypothetical protein
MTPMGPFPPLPEFLEEQLWAIRDRADALHAVPLPASVAATLAAVTDQLTDAALLLRRATRTNREGVTVLIGRMRSMLETIEQDAYARLRVGIEPGAGLLPTPSLRNPPTRHA